VVVYRRGSRGRFLLVLLALTAVTLITLDSRGSGGGVIGTARDAAHEVVAPVESAVDDVFSPVGDWIQGVADSGSLKADNRKLRDRLAAQRGREAEARAVIRENEQLKKLVDIPFIEDSDAVAARVIAGAPGNFERTIQIDRGSSRGLAVGMPVVAGAGLVGRITEVARTSATVELIDDPTAGVGVRLEKSGQPGIAQGRSGKAELTLKFVEPDVPVAKGELVFTSGLQNSSYPPNIPVAKVTGATRSRDGLEQTITLKPLVDLDQVEFVKVLHWPKASGG
jgi:rod shape-determining protein MreC